MTGALSVFAQLQKRQAADVESFATMVDYGSRKELYSGENDSILLSIVNQMSIKKVTVAQKYEPFESRKHTSHKGENEISATDIVKLLGSLNLLVERVDNYPFHKFREETGVLLNNVHQLQTEEFPMAFCLSLHEAAQRAFQCQRIDFTLQARIAHVLENLFYTSIGGTIENTPRYADGEIDSEVWAKMAYHVCQIKGGGSAMFWILVNMKVGEHLSRNLFSPAQIALLKECPQLNQNKKFFFSDKVLEQIASH